MSNNCKLCQQDHATPFYNQDEIILFEDGPSRIIGYYKFHGKPTKEQFTVLQDLMLAEAKKRWTDYDFIHKTDTYPGHYSLIIRNNKSKAEIITDNVTGKFCPLLNQKCIGKQCLYFKEESKHQDEFLVIHRDCLARLEKEVASGESNEESP